MTAQAPYESPVTDAMVRHAVAAYDEWMAENQPRQDDAWHDGMRAALTAALAANKPDTRQAQAQGSEGVAELIAADREYDSAMAHRVAATNRIVSGDRSDDAFRRQATADHAFDRAVARRTSALKNVTANVGSVGSDNAAHAQAAALQARIAELEARNAASERDAGRYRWLLCNAFRIEAPAVEFYWQSETDDRGPDLSLDKRIDAAIDAHAQGQAGEEKDG